MMNTRLEVTRAQILAFRRSVSALDERLPQGVDSLRRAAWAGLQDSMPRAALLSIHARVEGTEQETWADPSLIQLWGPRYSAYVVAEPDRAVFTLGRMPEDAKRRRVAEDLAERFDSLLDGKTMTLDEAAEGLGLDDRNRLRYAAVTGRVIIRWAGARQPTVWSAPPPEMEPGEARQELARRYLHVFGPTTPEAFAEWAGITRTAGPTAFDSLGSSLTPVTTPIGDAWILQDDEQALRSTSGPPALARLLPSGDTYFLLQGQDRALLVPEEHLRKTLWTTRVWPGALLVGGEIVGTWRRAGDTMTIQCWRRLTKVERDAVTGEAASLPLPGSSGYIDVDWED